MTDDLRLVICDFSGSGFGDLVCELGPETHYCKFVSDRNWVEFGIETKIFALGCLMFEIETGKKPFDELEERVEKDCQEIERRARAREWENVEGLEFGDVMRKCWEGEFESVKEILEAVREKMEKGDAVMSKL